VRQFGHLARIKKRRCVLKAISFPHASDQNYLTFIRRQQKTSPQNARRV